MSTVSRRQLLSWAAVAGVAGSTGLSLGACGTAAEKRISFLNWQDYVDPQILRDFTKKSGLEVGYETYESNDDLERRLSAASVTRKGGRKATSFDLIVPSSNLFSRLRSGNALQKLDTAVVTGQLLGNLDPQVLSGGVDAKNEYSVPWATGTTGIGYDTTVFSEPPTWDVFADSAYAGKASLLSEVREAFSAALLALGEDPNTTDATVIGAAEDKLKEFLDNAKANSSTYLDDLASGKLVVAQGYNTDVLQAAERNPDLAFVIPEAGGTIWTDLLCVPKDAPNPEGANELIAFYLDAEVSAANAEFNQVDTANLSARDKLPPDLLSNAAVYPPDSIRTTLVSLSNLGDAEQLYTDAWARLTAS